MSDHKPPLLEDPWAALRRFTAARIALGRTGASLPTTALLEFQLAHAQARDAVHTSLDVALLEKYLHAVGLTTLPVDSAANNRHEYLQRPDLGRTLSPAAHADLANWTATQSINAPDIAFVVADGLSALAVHHNAAAFIAQMLPSLRDDDWLLAPVVIVRQGRVAIGDEIGELLQARAVVMLIGERPGLSSPDSMGIYLTWSPHTGATDAARNCISNVRAGGLSHTEAAHKLRYLLNEARRRQLSGVALKDETEAPPLQLENDRNFLLGD